MSRIAVWFDGGGAAGLGNVRRSGELGDFLAARGHNVAMVPLSPLAAGLSRCPASADASADLVLVDAPHGAEEAVARARDSGARVVALDYEGPVAPDLAINLREPSANLPYPVLCGLELAIIRRDIRAAREHRGNSNEVLAIIGGGDTGGLARCVAERLAGERLCVVQGPAGPRLELRAAGVRVAHDPPDLPRLMANCSWSVTTGGTTMLEMLSLGKAVHVVPRTELEKSFARIFAERGALLGIGMDSLRSPDTASLGASAVRGPQLVDGRGCERIAAALEELL